jgi:tetratricopeptide (TPR) repeat protein
MYLADVLPEAIEETARKPTPEETSSNENQIVFAVPVEDPEVVSRLRNEHSFDWRCVDVVGSPGLTRLVGALTIEEYGLSDDIPNLDLASNSLGDVDIAGMDLMDLCSDWDVDEEDPPANESHLVKSKGLTDTSRLIKLLQTWTQSSLQFELFPFPTSSNTIFDPSRIFFSNNSSFSNMSESECLIKFRKLRQLQDEEISNLVNRMGVIASDLFNARAYATAEIWYRRTVAAKQKIKWHKPEQTLWACVQIPECVRLQGRYDEVEQQLHQDLHAKIERILGSDHPISVYSRLLKGETLDILGHPEEAEAVYRQVLQIHLINLGIKHPGTLYALERLGSCLIGLKRNTEAQRLCEITIYLRFQTTKTSGKVGDFELDVLASINMVAQGLDMDMKYEESERVLDCAHKLLGKATRLRRSEVYQYHFQRACTYQHQRRFDESESILKGLLKYHEDSLKPNFKVNVFQKLADLSFQTGRNHEGASWVKKMYLCDRKTYGLLHHYTMEDCATLGLCYANQRQYHEARLYFGSVIKEMTSSMEDSDSRMKCIQEVNSCMLKVEEMRVAASATNISEVEDPEVVKLGMNDGAEWEEMGDIPDPLC